MDIQEVKKYFEENKDSEDVKTYISEMSKPTPEAEQEIINKYIATDDFRKKYRTHSDFDQSVTKSIETWKKNNLPQILDEEIKKRFPKETEEQKELRELKTQLNDLKQEKDRERIANKLMKGLSDRALPLELLDHLKIEVEDTIDARLDAIKNLFDAGITTGVEKKLKTHSPGAPKSPDTQSGKPIYTTREQLAGVKQDEIVKAMAEGRIKITNVDLSEFQKK